MEEAEIQIKKDRLSNWINENFWFIVIFAFAIIIRLYYFTVTNGQPLWWDEAEYMSAAKSFAGIVEYQLSGNRLPGFPIIMSIFFILNITSETLLRFFGLLIPSLIVIFLTYLTIKEMYKDKKIALISTAIIAVLWEHLFYSNRFQTENFALIFQLLAVFVLFKVYMKKQPIKFITPKYSLIWVLIFSALAVFSRPGNFIFIPPMLLFIAIISKSTIFKKKFLPFWIILIILAILPLFFTSIYQQAFDSYYNAEEALSWNSLTVFKGFYPPLISWLPIVYWLFMLGTLLAIIDFGLRFPLLKNIKNNSENLDLKSDLFNLLTIAAVLTFFIFFLRPVNGFEWRWFFPLLLGMLAFTGKGIVTFSTFIGRLLKNKKIIIVLIVLITLIGIYAQLQASDGLIKNKITSYQQVKEAGIWINENSQSDEVIISASIPQHTFYSERKVRDFHTAGSNEEDFLNYVMTDQPEYYVISAFEPAFTPEWAYSFPERHQELLTPVQAYTQGEQPILAIYKFNYDNP